jgi:putative DNA primase/helicase
MTPYQRHIASLDSIPPEIRDLPIWCAWRLVKKVGKVKPDKVPVSPITSRGDEWTKAGFCTTAQRAIDYAESRKELHGIGLVLYPEFGIAGGDLDHCRNSETAEPSELAAGILVTANTYTEVSPSLSGYRFLAFGSFGGYTGTDNNIGVEFYEAGRFLTFTGNQVEDSPFAIEERDLTELGKRYFYEKKKEPTGGNDNVGEFAPVDIHALGLEPWTLETIFTGGDGNDRSVTIYRVIKDMLRAGCDDLTICRVLADQRFGISEKALENRGGNIHSAMRWVASQIPKLRLKVDEEARNLAEVSKALSNGDDDGWHVTPYGVEGLPDLSHDQLAIEIGKAGFAKDARYVAQWSKWLFWSGSRWERDERLMHFTAVRDYLRAKATKLIEWGDKKAEAIIAAGEDESEKQAKAVQAYARDNAKAMRQNPCVNAIESLAKSNAELVAVPSQFDADPMMLGTPKGTVELATGNVRPAARADYLTRQCAVAPAARSTPCPTWMAFLHRAMNGDAQMIEFLQRVIGYTLTGQTTEHKLFFLFGTGRNGKSVFVNTIFGMMGDYAKRAPAQTFLDSHGERHPTDLAGLQGARFVAGSELPAGKAWNESIIKDLTGGDVITARFMRGDFFDYRPQFTLFIAGNHQPAIKTTDEAMRARIVLVPFTVTIPEHERDPMLESKLRQEWAAILRWAIEGAVAWTQGGLQVPPSVRDASREYLDTEDHVGEFIDERLRTTSGNTLPSNELYRVFSDWQKNAGISPWSKKAMSQALTERGIKSEKLTGGTRGYRNLAVVPYATTDDYRYQSGR